MISIGNDIVALNAIDTQRTIDKKFYSKIITEAEHGLYEQGTMPLHQFVWLLWSAKEAAYKYLARLKPGLVFSPLRLAVSNILVIAMAGDEENAASDGYISSTISTDDTHLCIRSFITENYIASFAYIESFEQVHWGIKKIDDPHPANQSAMVRQFALHELNQLYNIPGVRIDKIASSIPVVIENDTVNENIALSFSHHQHYICYAFVVA